MLTALTHVVSRDVNRCELSYHDRLPIDYSLAVEQHEAYCGLLRECGARVIELDGNERFPDCTFVEDTAVVVDEAAVIANMGAESRNGETAVVEKALSAYRKIERIRPPATLEGGDVLRVGSTLYVGLSRRTNAEGADTLKRILEPLGYRIVPVALHGCLHLKSACVALDDGTLLANPEWLDLGPFERFDVVNVARGEPTAANALCINDVICLHAGFTGTAEKVKARGFETRTVDISELMKAEAGLTCSSILFDAPSS